MAIVSIERSKAIASDHNILEIFDLTHDEAVLSAIAKLRSTICDFIENDAASKKWILDLYHLSMSSTSVLDDFPALKMAIKTFSDRSNDDLCEDDFLNILCQEILTDRTWASEIEISILRDRLMVYCQVHLITLKARDKKQILQTFRLEKQLLIAINKIYEGASIDERMAIRYLVLIQINNNHYMYLVLQRHSASMTLLPIQALQLYIDDLLQDCSDEEISDSEDISYRTCPLEIFNTAELGDFEYSRENDTWTSDTFGLHGVNSWCKQDYEMARKFL